MQGDYFNIVAFAIIAVLSLIVELVTINLVSIWFVFSAVIVIIINLIHPISFVVSLILFLNLSLFQVLLFYKPLVKIFKDTLSPNRNKNKILPAALEGDKIKYEGVLYNFKEVDNLEIKTGDPIKIVGNQSTILLVEKVREEK